MLSKDLSFANSLCGAYFKVKHYPIFYSCHNLQSHIPDIIRVKSYNRSDSLGEDIQFTVPTQKRFLSEAAVTVL